MKKWPTKKLGEVCNLLTDGDWIESKDQDLGGEIRLVQTGNVGLGVFLDKNTKARHINQKTFENLNCKEIYPGDILISRLPEPVGRACILPDLNSRMITAVDCAIVRVDESIINKNFLLTFLCSTGYFNQLQDHLTGTTRKRISRTNLSKIEVPLPPLEEQKRIVEVLEEKLGAVKEAIQFRQNAIADTEKILTTKLTEIFDNQIEKKVKIKDVSVVKTGGTPAKSNQEYWSGVIPWVSPKDMKSWEIEDALDHISKKAVDETSANVIPKNSILVVVRSGILKHTLPVSIARSEVSFNQDIKAIVPNTKVVLPLYLAYWIKGHQKLILEEGIKKGVTVQSFEGKYLENFQVALPSLQTQEKIVQELDALTEEITKLRKQQDAQLTDLKSLERAYLHEAFSGELV